MNKDLACVSAIWRTLFGVRVTAFTGCFSCLSKEAAENGFWGGFWGPSLETGAVLDAVLSVNYCANCDLVSVRAVREKCDEKRQVVRVGKAYALDGPWNPTLQKNEGWGTLYNGYRLCQETRRPFEISRWNPATTSRF